MSRGLDQRLRRLERLRPGMERAAERALRKFEFDRLLAQVFVTARGEHVPLVEMRGVFGPNFLRDPSRRCPTK